MTFKDLGLSQKVCDAVEAAGYTTPTPVQTQAIPAVLQKQDVLGIAQTGTGKTAAFTLPMLTLLETGRARARMPRTLILEPTRELAAQVEENFIKYGINHKLNVALLIGGVSFGDQDAKITRGVDVLIATPGRLLDHFERGKLLLTGVELLVIDEADRMLDMGFIPDIERICKLVPFTRQTLFFTATMPPEIQKITETFLHNPTVVKVERISSANSTITSRLIKSEPEDWEKREVLRNLIKSQAELKNGIIFCNRKVDVETLYKSLLKYEFSAVALHGDMDQKARMEALERFKNNEVQLLVASDVAARGLDIPDVSHVFNFDVPVHAEDYVHRIGRTGRAGRLGNAFTLITTDGIKGLLAIEDMLGEKLIWEGEAIDPSQATDPRRRKPKAKAKAKPERAERKARPERAAKPERAARAEHTPLDEKAIAIDEKPVRAERPKRDEKSRYEERPKRDYSKDDKIIYRGSSGSLLPDADDKNPELPAFLTRTYTRKVFSDV